MLHSNMQCMLICCTIEGYFCCLVWCANMLSVVNVCVARQERSLFEPISFELKAGEAVHLVAPNGVGKSTLMKALLGHYPFSGHIMWQGRPLVDQLENSHFLPHGEILLSHLRVQQQLEYWAAVFGQSIPVSVMTFLEDCGLTPYLEAPIQHLSAGQARKLALSSLFFSFRPLWILDEPLTALDQEAQGLFLDRGQRHLQSGGCIIAACHQPLPSYFKQITLVPSC